MLRLPFRRPAPETLPDSTRRVVHMIASVLLDYPEGLARKLEAIRPALADLPAEVGAPLTRFVEHAASVGERALCEHYVKTFDQRRRATLYLSYYTAGDTRQRGLAILDFHDALAAAGVELVRREQADFLPVVLEMSATGDHAVAERTFGAHRGAIETIREALAHARSPYLDVVDGLLPTLPPLDEAARDQVRALISEGPPTELVGLTSLPFPVTASAQEVRL